MESDRDYDVAEVLCSLKLSRHVAIYLNDELLVWDGSTEEWLVNSVHSSSN